MNSLRSGTSKKGDLVSARVISPAALQGDIVEGKVTNSDSSGGARGKSVLRFSFKTLRHASQTIPISSQIQSVTNSKGQADVDEDSYVIRKSNNLAKVAKSNDCLNPDCHIGLDALCVSAAINHHISA
jgi:hypothetical protein